MFFQVIGAARDVAIILLALEAFVFCLVVLLATHFLQRGLRRLLPQVALALAQAREFMIRLQGLVERLMAAIRAPFVWIDGASVTIHKAIKHIPQWDHRGR